MDDDKRDAERYRKLRASNIWTFYEVIWEEAYLGVVNAQGEMLDERVDKMPAPKGEKT